MIVPFKRKARPVEEPQYATGEAFCLQCGHEWEARAFTGEVRFECPECHTEKGLFKFQCYPGEGALVRECDCGNQLFYLTPQGHLCPNCGIYQSYD